MPPKMELANALRFIVILIVTYEKKKQICNLIENY